MTPINMTVVERLEPVATWDEGARRAASLIIQNIDFLSLELRPSEKSEISPAREQMMAIRKCLNLIIDKIMYQVESKPSMDEMSLDWRNFGTICFEAGQKLNIFNKPAAGHIDEISDILVRKQRDYGHDNIARFGRVGIAIRLHDKVARLENLISNNVNPQNESVLDNFVDLIGYAAIGIMWEENWYMKDVSR